MRWIWIDGGTFMKLGTVVSIVGLVTMQLLFATTNAYATQVHLPEPTTLTLLGIGSAAVAVGAWWRKRK